MSTQRPFFANFLAAFRAHPTQIPKITSSITPSAAVASSATIWTSASAQQLSKPSPSTTETTPSSPRPINTKSNPYTQTNGAPVQDRQLVASLSPLQHNVSPQTHLPRSPSSPGLPTYGPHNKPQSSYPTCQEARRGRRGSDSSFDSGGFREVRGGGEKWFIGGLTANGEEKYYKLSMIKRDRSWDRISADQLSL
ncbi:uncharacterized protein K489DRAFT_375453 [Dissoconium aciculare CBS 342.82]|uniref:Uncharacterized protein n=1 Tax=Dissoconium aciculare CBS 342.82 TaxID=1314786 RepID=A0A6J3MK86_9PEZI|nr:uncharacterized protein K489DRAFT_375453 [Dissoconium aciculare CBS 342.82]KAF1827367.1 hypothetical protein K489DRAFT_375453 [Dissoconium aciculare CBS 342.82]